MRKQGAELQQLNTYPISQRNGFWASLSLWLLLTAVTDMGWNSWIAPCTNQTTCHEDMSQLEAGKLMQIGCLVVRYFRCTSVSRNPESNCWSIGASSANEILYSLHCSPKQIYNLQLVSHKQYGNMETHWNHISNFCMLHARVQPNPTTPFASFCILQCTQTIRWLQCICKSWKTNTHIHTHDPLLKIRLNTCWPGNSTRYSICLTCWWHLWNWCNSNKIWPIAQKNLRSGGWDVTWQGCLKCKHPKLSPTNSSHCEHCLRVCNHLYDESSKVVVHFPCLGCLQIIVWMCVFLLF